MLESNENLSFFHSSIFADEGIADIARLYLVGVGNRFECKPALCLLPSASSRFHLSPRRPCKTEMFFIPH